MICDIASKGGNYLLNVGPTAEGVFPQESIDRLKQIGSWMKMNGEAIYTTAASPFENLSWGRCTQKRPDNGNTRLFLHVFHYPDNGRLVVPGIFNEPLKAIFLICGLKSGEGGSTIFTYTKPFYIKNSTTVTVSCVDIPAAGRNGCKTYGINGSGVGTLPVFSALQDSSDPVDREMADQLFPFGI